jgi:ribosomal biogenesis protein LAS1
MTWLLHNYFLPIISPPTDNPEEVLPLRPLTPSLIEYKNAMKIIIRDVSLASQQKHKVIALIRDLERWIAESRVTANSVVEDSWTHIQFPGSPMTASDPKEIWALEKFCDKLSEQGRLVPLSKKFVYFASLAFFTNIFPGSDNLPSTL